MQVSDEGRAFIKREEALRLRPYDDGVGFQTIGWGHLIRKGEMDGISSISKARAQELFDEDIKGVEDALGRLVRVDLTQGQYDALASFLFNLGEDKVRKSTLFRKLNDGDYDSVPCELNRWVNSGGKPLRGLVARREREGKVFSAATERIDNI